ncbi:hypothetical protein H6F93_15510 [Leptolyngbya sp. FACHB-671]|uniref:hypothetical protein n=1 Tax=Leptolyngbya sp. FACHB-671 TaxID=2692812 RepID=UPI00168A017F|nr:hypothetical protein [Leptolyngbya sp. FACHB-671]MBD2068911.1 hypothetical protein [Leptolyngbya sp. FACHB-671]
MKTITRKQLVDLGASKYQAELVTKSLTPLRKQGRANVYDLFAASDRCKELIENKRLKEATRNAIQSLRWAILSLAEQIQDAPFGMSGLEQLEYADKLHHRAEDLFTQTKAKAQQMKKTSAKKTSTPTAKGTRK